VSTPDVTLVLTQDEALVLFEVLGRWEDADSRSGSNDKLGRIDLVDEAEWWVMNGLLSFLETRVAVAFSPDYQKYVEAAKISVVPEGMTNLPLPRAD
jgi:hypothetical protein